MSAIKKTITINAPTGKVYETIVDFESYPDFMPEMKDAAIEKKTAKEMVVSFTLELFSKINYRLRIKLDKPKGLSWSLIDGQMMKSNDGSWELKSLAGGKTKAIYTIDVGFGPLVPKSISNLLVDKNLPEMLKNFKRRAES